jgi:nitroreductase
MLEIMKQRHSVRQYKDKVIETEKRETLNALIGQINQKAGLGNCKVSF